jgi:hypothetical protein
MHLHSLVATVSMASVTLCDGPLALTRKTERNSPMILEVATLELATRR